MAIMATLNKRLMRFSRRRLGEKTTRDIREFQYKTARRLKGFPQIRKNLLFAIDGQHLFVSCRLLDPDNVVEHINLHYDSGDVQTIDNNLVHYRTSQTSMSRLVLTPAANDQFAGMITHPDGVIDVTAISLELSNGKRVKQRVSLAPVPADPLAVISRILKLIPIENTYKRHLFDTAFGPAITRLWDTRKRHPASVDAVTYNASNLCEQPQVSIIIPIYGRYDFIEYQIAQFSNDPDMRRHEIIYVIDDPRIVAEVRQSCSTLARIYPLAFRVLYLENNLGYAGANNVGVQHSAAPTVLLLNSDVFAEQPGWLATMLDTAGDHIKTTLVGARLIYEDKTIQHNGMQFFASPFVSNLWTNIHPGKGIPLDLFPASSTLQDRESVTGACLLLSRDNYEMLGGLDESYILGDFEDSDLCMKARAQGLSVAIVEQVSLYHLERQSQSLVSEDRWKQELTYYNCWYHTQKWDADIKALKQACLQKPESDQNQGPVDVAA